MNQRIAKSKKAQTTMAVEGITVIVVRKRVRNINLRVHADGSVVVSASPRVSKAAIEAFVTSKSEWIKRAQDRLLSQSSIHNETCEENQVIWVWGQPYRCHVIPASNTGRATYSFKLLDNLLLATVPPKYVDNSPSSTQLRSKRCVAWLKEELTASVNRLLPHCEDVVHAHSTRIRIRAMKSRWGSCNVETGVITLNLHLVHHEPECLEYVLCHELCHLHEPSHNAHFHELMDQCYPNWRLVRAQLNGKK